jgi:hypothetical protein
LEIPHLEQAYAHAYLILAPILENDLALIGETGKFVTVSDKRFTDLRCEAEALQVELAGVPGEGVELVAFDARQDRLLPPVAVTIGTDGTARATLSR